MKSVGRFGVLLLASLVVAAVIPCAFTGADEETVVISRPGTVFHRTGSTDIRGRGIQKGVEAALAMGYTPCHVCFAKEASASRLSGPSTAAASATGFGRGNGNGRPTTGPAVEQPAGLQFGHLYAGHYLDKHVKDPYAELQTARTVAREQGAYGEDVSVGHYND